jgi:hypothetical protein
MRWKLVFVGLWRHHRVATVTVCAATLALTAATVGWSGSSGPGASAEHPARGILNRVWFDHYPQSTRDEISVGIWLAGGLGIFEQGSVWRTGYEIFEFERNGDRLTTRLLQDRAESRTRFRVESCDDQPPFDLCLLLEQPTRGPARYYSFGDGDDMAEHLPWAGSLLGSARARVRAAAHEP